MCLAALGLSSRLTSRLRTKLRAYLSISPKPCARVLLKHIMVKVQNYKLLITLGYLIWTKLGLGGSTELYGFNNIPPEVSPALDGDTYIVSCVGTLVISFVDTCIVS